MTIRAGVPKKPKFKVGDSVIANFEHGPEWGVITHIHPGWPQNNYFLQLNEVVLGSEDPENWHIEDLVFRSVKEWRQDDIASRAARREELTHQSLANLISLKKKQNETRCVS